MSVHNGRLQEFFEAVCGQIRYNCVHKTIINELEDHIEQQKGVFIEKGFDEETALDKTLEQMGDPVVIGKQFNKTYKPQTEWSVLAVTFLLVLCGGVVQFFFSINRPSGADPFIRFLFYAPVGIILAAVAYFFDYTLLGKYSKTVFMILSAACLAGFVFSQRIFGSYAFVYYSTLLFIPVYASVIYGYRNKGYAGILLCGLFYVIPALFCVYAPSLSGLVFLTCSGLILLTFAIVRGFFGVNKTIGLLMVYVPFITVSVLTVLTLDIFQSKRFVSFFNPQADPLGHGFIPMMIRKLIAASKPFGRASLDGFMNHEWLENIMPGWNTDFSLTYIIAKFGLIPGIIVILAFLFLVVKLFIIVFREKNAFGFLLSLACCLALSLQIILYIVFNLGLVSPVGSTLPLISYGVMGFLTNIILIGLFLSVHRRAKLVMDRFKLSEQKQARIFTISDGKLIIDLGWRNDKTVDGG